MEDEKCFGKLTKVRGMWERWVASIIYNCCCYYYYYYYYKVRPKRQREKKWRAPLRHNRVMIFNQWKHFLIKQVAPIGFLPYKIYESQLVRRLFFRQPGHAKYSENLIGYEITKLKNDENVLKVLTQSNHWKRYCTLKVLTIFNKPVIKIEEDMYPAQHISDYCYFCHICVLIVFFNMFHYSRLSS